MGITDGVPIEKCTPGSRFVMQCDVGLLQDVGDGWWEGMNGRGEQGLFPEAYVQVRRRCSLHKALEQTSNSHKAPRAEKDKRRIETKGSSQAQR